MRLFFMQVFEGDTNHKGWTKFAKWFRLQIIVRNSRRSTGMGGGPHEVTQATSPWRILADAWGLRASRGSYRGERCDGPPSCDVSGEDRAVDGTRN